jgi:uncharacterized protein (DUF1697 family)
MKQVAFLRAINVGGRRIKMAELRGHFVAAGFDEVETYLASGNVVFDAEGDRIELENRIEVHLRDALGYDVVTFVRAMSEVSAVAEANPFGDQSERTKRYVTFLKSELDPAQYEDLDDLNDEVDEFVAHGLHVHWLRRLDAGESLSNMELERALGVDGTRRTLNTLQRIVAKFDEKG